MIDREKVINELRFQLYSKEVKDEHYPVQLSASDATAILALLIERQWRKFEFREPDAEEKEAYPEWAKVLIGGPDDGDEILVSNGKYVWKDEFYVDDTCYLDSDADLEECWWMPLPEPPKEDEA